MGLGVRAKSAFPVLWGALFGGGPLIMAIGESPIASFTLLLPLAAGMAAFGFRKGGTSAWAKSARGARSSDDSTGWVMGGGSSDGKSSGGSDSGFGGGRSGGGGASGRW
jgi:hypothetical protein